MDSSQAMSYTGVTLEGLEDTSKEAPVVIQNCVIRRAQYGLRVSGIQPDIKGPWQCRGVSLQTNDLEDCGIGVITLGAVRDVQIVGNRIRGSSTCGISLQTLLEETQNVLVANNTLFANECAFRLHDDAKKSYRGKNIQVRNNLVLNSPNLDMAFLDHGGVPIAQGEPGDGPALRQAWQFDHNWRETRLPKGEATKGWIPPSQEDVRRDTIDGVGRDPKDAATFLQPTKDSELATQGAGVTNPSLPSYVGALPPPGVEPWDWSRTWLAPPPGKLITVSKDPKDLKSKRTLQEALDAATPWATIRVLDAETYDGPLELTDAEKHTGVVLEAPKRATIRLTANSLAAVRINGVAHVRFRGFDFRAAGQRRGSVFIQVQGHTPGTVLDDLSMDAAGEGNGIFLNNIDNAPGEPPMLVRRCQIKVPMEGIRVFGPSKPGKDATTSHGIALQDNRVFGGFHGLHLGGSIANVQITGNLLWGISCSALTIEDLAPHSRSILIANNTACKSGDGFRIWCNTMDNEFVRGQVEVCANLFLEDEEGDAALFVANKDGSGREAPETARTAVDLWRFEGNWRDLGGNHIPGMLPLSPGDRKTERLNFLAIDPGSADFMRPPEGSPLATGGLGAKGPWLPEYAGAMPPKGVSPWDWSLTWRGRLNKHLPQ